MSRIQGKDTKPEMIVRKVVHRLGYRYRLHQKDLPGKPDLVFRKYQSVIFMHGCFWHTHKCKYGKVKPKKNSAFWDNKRKRTVQRDKENLKALKKLGWNVLVLWECQLKDIETLQSEIISFFENK